MINKYTPLSRIQKRLEQWKETLRIRLAVKNEMLVGQIAVAIQGDKVLEAELVEQAKAAVRDWEAAVRMVSAHEELLEALRTLSNSLSQQYGNARLCEPLRSIQIEAKKAIAKAEGKE